MALDIRVEVGAFSLLEGGSGNHTVASPGVVSVVEENLLPMSTGDNKDRLATQDRAHAILQRSGLCISQLSWE